MKYIIFYIYLFLYFIHLPALLTILNSSFHHKIFFCSFLSCSLYIQDARFTWIRSQAAAVLMLTLFLLRLLYVCRRHRCRRFFSYIFPRFRKKKKIETGISKITTKMKRNGKAEGKKQDRYTYKHNKFHEVKKFSFSLFSLLLLSIVL